MKRIIFSLLFVSFVFYAFAGIPAGYYSNANGKKKAELKSAMRAIVGTAKVLNYGSGAGKTWTGFYQTDRLPDGQVVDRYSNEKFYFAKTASASGASAVNGMNIEHSFPKSWWGGIENQAYKDLYNLMPSEQRINSSKSNYPMGVVTDVTTNNGCTKVGRGKAGSKTVQLWEPADKWKGDFARSYFYMVTTYSNFRWQGDQALAMLENNEWPTLQPWAYELFVKWNREDPVDELEKERNEAVYNIQGNRNPFIDYPFLCEYIWGDSINYAFSVDGASTDVPDIGGDKSDLIAYEANEIVSAIYSKRFDANWSKYAEDVAYTLDVYTKDAAGVRTSFEGFPVVTFDTSYRVKGVKPGVTYYYQVQIFDDNGKLVCTSNEVRVDFPEITPVLAVSVSQINFTSVPDVASASVKVSLTLEATKEKVTYAKVDAPFALAMIEDAEEWDDELRLEGTSPSFYVRLSSATEGSYNGYLYLNTVGVEEKKIPLTAIVDEFKAFFEDFEKGSKSSYAESSVTCTAAKWRMKDVLIGKDTNANDLNAVRIKGGGCLEMLDDKSMGCDSLWFYASNYNSDTGVKLTVSYSLDGGTTWKPIVSNLVLTTWQRYGYEIDRQGSIRLKFEGVGTSSKRINVDDIQMSDYMDKTGIRLPQTDEEGGQADAFIYNLQGQRVSIPQKGIYIINGKKYLR